MKDSGAKYIGDIPESWLADKAKYHLKRSIEKNHEFAVVLSLYREYGVLPKDSRDDNHNVTSEDTSKYLFVKKGNFVINKMKAWQGSMAVSDFEGIVSPAYYVYIFIDNSLDKKYFHHLLRNKAYTPEFRRLSGGIREGQWDLPEDAFNNILILVPPLEEQKAIADFLDKKCGEIDEISGLIEKQIETLEQYKRSMITEAVTKGLNPGVALKDSGIEWIGDVPEHWDVTKNRYLFQKKKEIVGANWENTQLLSLTKKGIIEKDIDEGGGKQPGSFATYQLVEKGDIMLCLFDLDVSAVFSGLSSLSGMISPAYKRFVCNNGLLNRYYAYYFDAVFVGRHYKLYSKNLRYTVDDDGFDSIFSLVPPLEEQKAIADFLDKKCGEIDEIIKDKQAQLEKIDAYKKSLIYEYVTGKKEVLVSEAN